MDKIFVTKPYLPPMEEYFAKIAKIWDTHQLTNFGPLHQEFEDELKKYLKVDNLYYVTNGTIGLELALSALQVTGGEIITTPFTFIATTSSIVWQNFKPIFVDIDKYTFNIDANKIEEKITNKTRAILAVHCFGLPCDVQKINEISQKYHLPVIYDAAHTFGINYEGKSLLKQGDISVCSFHATKVFHSVEGGLCVVNNPLLAEQISMKRNFGMKNGLYEDIGINGKASEFHAAMGLCVLNHLDEIIAYRKNISNLYRERLSDYVYLPDISYFEYSYIYFPIVLESEDELLNIMHNLNRENIFPRRYFYPAINEIDIYKDGSKTPNSSSISKRILCLPLDTYITFDMVEKICAIIKNSLGKKKTKILI